jgi:hypothetical protein
MAWPTLPVPFPHRRIKAFVTTGTCSESFDSPAPVLLVSTPLPGFRSTGFRSTPNGQMHDLAYQLCVQSGPGDQRYRQLCAAIECVDQRERRRGRNRRCDPRCPTYTGTLQLIDDLTTHPTRAQPRVACIDVTVEKILAVARRKIGTHADRAGRLPRLVGA